MAIALILALVSAGVAAQAWLSARALRQHPPPGRLVAVNGTRIHLNCQGNGTPAIVLIAGLAGWSQDWSAVQPRLARYTTVCSYDRPGYGWSGETPAPLGGVALVRQLHTLLERGHVPAGRVIVGHSFGGGLAQLYAQLYPQDATGIALIDALDGDQPETIPSDLRARYVRNMTWLTQAGAMLSPTGVLRATGVSASLVADRLPITDRAAARALARNDSAYRAIRNEFARVDAALGELHPDRFPQIPAAVLASRENRDFPPGWDNPAMRAVWATGQRNLGEKWRAPVVTVPKAGHYLQLERPTLVTCTILRIAGLPPRPDEGCRP